MRLIHNSRLPQFRTPFGAVTTGTSVALSVILEDADPNQATLTLRTWVDEIGESLYPMTHEGDGMILLPEARVHRAHVLSGTALSATSRASPRSA
ncbi:MAG: hypothetical protein ACLTHL_07930 [Collinsella sp.]